MIGRFILLVDFGASRIKAALWDNEKKTVIDSAEAASPSENKSKITGGVEFDAEDYWIGFEKTVGSLLNTHVGKAITEIWTCFEMHGFLLTDVNGKPFTGYVSWRDQRANADMGKGKLSSYQHLFRKYAKSFKNKTGMRLRPGLPFITLGSMQRSGILPQVPFRILTLSDWLLVRGGCRSPKAHPSLAAGTGLFNITKLNWDRQLLQWLGLGHRKVELPEIAQDRTLLGTIRVQGKDIAVFGGYGDLQAAVFGAGFLSETNAIINLGTGSQVAVAQGYKAPKTEFAEFRLSVQQGTLFRTITHVPSGRALQALANYFDEVSAAGGGKPVFWEIWASLSPEEVLSSSVQVDLNLFESAWKFSSQSGWLRLRESDLGPKEVIAGIALAWLTQYQEAIALLDPHGKQRAVTISGGLSRRAGFVMPVLSNLLKRECKIKENLLAEETLSGLAMLATQDRV